MFYNKCIIILRPTLRPNPVSPYGQKVRSWTQPPLEKGRQGGMDGQDFANLKIVNAEDDWQILTF